MFFDKDLTETKVYEKKYCDLCKEQGKKTLALYDAKIKSMNGRWGYLCQEHFDKFDCKLGLAQGQKLLFKEIEMDEQEVSYFMQELRDMVVRFVNNSEKVRINTTNSEDGSVIRLGIVDVAFRLLKGGDFVADNSEYSIYFEASDVVDIKNKVVYLEGGLVYKKELL